MAQPYSERIAQHGLPGPLKWPERIVALFKFAGNRLAAGRLVYDHVVLDQDNPVEAPANNVRFAPEIHEIRPEIPVALAGYGFVFQLISLAGGICKDAVVHPFFQFESIDGRIWDEAAKYVGVIENNDIRIGVRIQLELLKLLHGGFVRDDLVEGLLSFLKALPRPLYDRLLPGKQGTASGNPESNQCNDQIAGCH